MTKSLWKDKSPQPDFSSLQEEFEVDVAIVGGGITGITTAYLLAQSGKAVCVLEANEIASGTTGDSTGNLYTMLDHRLHHIQTKWDDKTAGAVAKSRTQAVNLIESLVEDLQLDCDFKRIPWYLFSETNAKDETIEREKKAAEQYGLEAEILHELPLPFPVSSALKIENQAQFNPAAFVRELSQKINNDNCSIFENTPVRHIEKGTPHVLSTPNAQVMAKKVILATHTPKGVYGLQTKVFPHREYALAVKLNSGEYPEGIFWDTEAKNHSSLRSYQADGEKYLLVLGRHHKVGQGDDGTDYFAELEKNARKNFDLADVAYKWSAQHYKSADGLPYIGESSDDNIFLATGFATDGLTYGVLSAIIFNDLLNDKKNTYAQLYKPGRFTPIKSAKNFLKENIDVLGEYLQDYPGNAEVKKMEKVRPGQGKVMEIKNEKWAVHRSPQGKLHACSAVCTHMDCIVNWNKEEKTWDCPCHGSRFTATGDVIEGPAFSPLDKRKINQNE